LPDAQHACPDPPQLQLPFVHVFPLLQVAPDAVHPLVSQHPPPLHVPPAQQAKPDEPHAWQPPGAQTLPWAMHAAPLLTHTLVPGSQQPFALHMPPEQHA
jgi:hypothetical protein